MAKTVFDVLVEKINEQIEINQEALISGTCQDFAKYRELCGVIHGLATARREIKDLAKYTEENDD